jgi:hypothetical protein
VEQLFFLEGRGVFPGFNHQQDCLKKHLGNKMEEGMRKSTTHLTNYHIKVGGLVRGENPIFIAHFHVNRYSLS